MPSTITAYTTFVAGTKAKATEINNNLSNHRGTLLPITEATATVSDLTYDLGTSEHPWRETYTNNINFHQTSGSNIIKFQISAAELDLFIDSITSCNFGVNGMNWDYLGPAVVTGSSSDTATIGKHVLLSNLATSGSLNGTGSFTPFAFQYWSKYGGPVCFEGIQFSGTENNFSFLVAPTASVVAFRFNVMYGLTITSLSTISSISHTAHILENGLNYNVYIPTTIISAVASVAVGKNFFGIQMYATATVGSFGDTSCALDGSFLVKDLT